MVDLCFKQFSFFSVFGQVTRYSSIFVCNMEIIRVMFVGQKIYLLFFVLLSLDTSRTYFKEISLISYKTICTPKNPLYFASSSFYKGSSKGIDIPFFLVCSAGTLN